MLFNRSRRQAGSAASVSQHVSKFDYTVKGELRMAARTMAPLDLWCLSKYTEGPNKQTIKKKKPVHCTTVRSIQPRRCHCLCKAQLGRWWELGRAASQGITRVHTGDWKCSTFKKGLVSTSAGNKTVLLNFQIILSSDWQWCITHETRGFFKRASKARGRKPFSGRDYIDDNVALVNVPKLHPFGWLYKGGY